MAVLDGDFITKEHMKKFISDFESLKSKLKGEIPECSTRPRKKVVQ